MLSIVDVPIDIVEAILWRHLADPSARLTDLEVEPISSDGYSGNHLFRARLAWKTADGPSFAAWVLKRWLPGGHSESQLGIDRPLEALGWQHGLLRPEAMPPGVVAPIVGAWPDRDERAAWIAMEDVSSALGRYSREAPLQSDEAVVCARLVLDRMARLHTHWERPEQRPILRRCSWLVPGERYLWSEAASVAAALGRTAPGGIPAGSVLTDEYRADVAAFFAWLPSGDRAMFEELFCNRERLVAALRPLPRTLVHGDLGDRNLGLRWPISLDDGPELVLIDWEWMGFGTPALDVARLWGGFPAICDLSRPLPEAAFSFELPDYYFERYRAYGGVLLDARAWQRICALTLLGLGMSQVSFAGSMIRHNVTPVVAGFSRQIETMTAAARSLFAN